MDPLAASPITGGSMARKIVARLIVALVLGCVVGYAVGKSMASDAARGQSLTLKEYIADFENHKKELIKNDLPMPFSVVLGTLLIMLVFGFYELLGIAASLQQVQTGFLDRNVTVAGRAYHYQVYVPADYQTKPTWPAILFLHGAGERGNDGLLQTNVGLGPAIRQNPARYPAIVVFPQAPPDSQWVGTPADMAVAALQQTLREFHVDLNRVYLTGLSMGGHGTWYIAYRHPELFAAIVPICGWVR